MNKTFDSFETRHIGPQEEDLKEMLHSIKVSSVDELIDQTIPASIRIRHELNLPKPQSEYHFINSFKQLAQKNKVYTSCIGMGYYDCITPPVILRNILENPGWYTAYTPYQAEIAQGRLEALLNFQTMVCDLTGMEIANASLLDEATAAAEAMTMFYHTKKETKKEATKFIVSDQCFPQTIDVLQTRATPLGIKLVVDDISKVDLTDLSVFGILLQYPGQDGGVIDYTSLIASAHEYNVAVVVAADLLSLALLTPPGEMGADVVVGSSQRFGIPMGCGGPHAAYFATKEEYKRQIPGRIIGVSVDVQGNKAYRMALQTREQHIRREKATSNICTAQVLLAVMAGAYAVYHGPQGLKAIAERIYVLTETTKLALEKIGFTSNQSYHFDTLKIAVPVTSKDTIRKLAEEDYQINFRYFDTNHIGISMDETKSVEDVKKIVEIFTRVSNQTVPAGFIEECLTQINTITLPEKLKRKSAYLTHPIFHSYHAEHDMLRYLKKLENKDLSLVHSMISLGSCTMKLNATTEMIPVSWAEFGRIHPFAPSSQMKGYQELVENLEKWLCEVTGFSATSLQPNSGAQGEYAGLMVIRAYHLSRGDTHRHVALIPSSAHGTNPASAVMAGMKVVVVACDERGNINVQDLRDKAKEHAPHLSCLMVTYPSTHGVFEESIQEICTIIHQSGGLVYMDGANMNAQVGLTNPAHIGADVCHINLHKTFCIPHGGGGPGMGPICVNEKLASFLPGHSVVQLHYKNAIQAVSAAPYGSASILPISYAYIAMMGGIGLKKATEMAIVNANYIKSRLENYYPVLYTGQKGRCAHEMIIDCRSFKQVGIEVEDIAKRLMDYGFHAPTVSFPVPGTMMIEPTESESKAELDRFCDAMISIRQEIQDVIDGKVDSVQNVLKQAPHTAAVITGDVWNYPYSRQQAAYPLDWVKENKFWPSVSRIDNAYGDRNLICTCEPIESYI